MPEPVINQLAIRKIYYGKHVAELEFTVQGSGFDPMVMVSMTRSGQLQSVEFVSETEIRCQAIVYRRTYCKENVRFAVGVIALNDIIHFAKVTREFQRLKSHYLFQKHFCLVRSPNEKGQVERLLDYARSNFLVPVPRVLARHVRHWGRDRNLAMSVLHRHGIGITVESHERQRVRTRLCQSAGFKFLLRKRVHGTTFFREQVSFRQRLATKLSAQVELALLV